MLRDYLTGSLGTFIQQLEARDQPITLENIGRIMNMPATHLRRYSRIQRALKMHSKRSKKKFSYKTVPLNRKSEKKLLKQTKLAIKQLEFFEKPLTKANICSVVGKTYPWIIHYPRIKAFLMQIKERRKNSIEQQKLLMRQRINERIESTIKRIEIWGEPVSVERIGVLTNIPLSAIIKFQKLNAHLQLHESNTPEDDKWVKHHEEDLLERAKSCVAQCTAQGKRIFWYRICKAIGLGSSQRRLELYPRLKAYLNQYSEKKIRSLEYIGRHEKTLLIHIDQVVVRLKKAGEEVTPRSVSIVARLPMHVLDDYPNVKARLQDILDDVYRTRMWQHQQQEEGIVQSLLQRIRNLENQKQPPRQQTLLRFVKLTKRQAKKYPRVVALLNRFPAK